MHIFITLGGGGGGLLMLAKACNAFRVHAVFSDFTFTIEHVQQGGERMKCDKPRNLDDAPMLLQLIIH